MGKPLHKIMSQLTMAKNVTMTTMMKKSRQWRQTLSQHKAKVTHLPRPHATPNLAMSTYFNALNKMILWNGL